MHVATPSGWQMLSGTGDAPTRWWNGLPGTAGNSRGWGQRLVSLLHMSPDRAVLPARRLASVAAWLLQHTLLQNSLLGTSLCLLGQGACFDDGFLS